MALLLALGALGAGSVASIAKMESDKREMDKIKKAAQKYIPNSALFQSQAKAFGLQTHGHVKRAIPDVDLRGVPFTWLDYGGGSYHKSYAPPGLLYNGAQTY